MAKEKSKTARVIKRSAEMIHSDSELAQKMEPAVQAPEAGPSNTELVENSHEENGASPVLDGDLKSPERPNVNAMREALEAQSEMEVGKPIAEKQEEIKAEEAGKTMEIDAQPGKQIIINIASWDYPTKKAAFLNPKTARFLTVDEMRTAGREYLNMVRTASIQVEQGEDADGFHMLINMGGREYVLYGEDAEDFRKEYAAIPKPEDKVNALVEKYIWKLQPYGNRRSAPAKSTPAPKSEEPKPDIEGWLRKQEPSVDPVDEANYWAGRGAPTQKDREEAAPNIDAWLRKKEQEEKGVKPNEAPDIDAWLKKKEREDDLKKQYTRYGVPGHNYASKKAGIFDDFLKRNKNVVNEEVQPKQKRPATDIPVRVRMHQEAMGFGKTEKGLEPERARLVGTTYPGYVEVEFANGSRKIVPSFAVLTTKAGWKVINEEGKRLQQEHADQCGNPNCIACSHIPGTPSHALSQENIKKDKAREKEKYMQHVNNCTDPNCTNLQHRWYNRDKFSQELFGKEFSDLNQKQRDKVWAAADAEEAKTEQLAQRTKGLPVAQASKQAGMKVADYEGWENWATWHVNLLIDNTESTYNSKRRLAQNALRKGIGIDQLANQFSRMFKRQYKETKEFYENNAADARDSRGAWERKKLEGVTPNKDYKTNEEKKQYFKDMADELFYGIGGQSGWEEPFEEVNWREIAQHALENEREEGSVPEQKQKAPQFSEKDQNFLSQMGIKGSKNMDKNKKKAAPMDTQVEPMAPVTIPSAPETPEVEAPQEIDDPVLVREVAEELFPGFDFAELSASQQRDVLLVARERKNEMGMQAADKTAGDGMVKNVGEVEKEAGFNFFFPGQVTKEFYPELMHEIVDYPNANNTPMGVETPEIVGDGGDQQSLESMLDSAFDNMGIVESIDLPGDIGEIEEVTLASKNAYTSTSPAGGMGIGRDGKSQVLEGVPLRKENDIRGPMFTDEFYGQYEGISGDSLSAMASLKSKRAADEADVDQFSMFLKKVVGEIAATFIAAFKVTSRPLLDKVPGVGEVQLQYVEQPQGMSAFNTVNTGSRVKYLMDKLTDSEIQDAINDAWAQGAVWHDGPKGGYVYEVFVRAESIDTDSMIMKYKFVAGTRE